MIKDRRFTIILHSKLRNIVNMVVNVSLAEEINLTHGYYVTNYSLLPIYRLIYDTTSLNMMMISQHATTFSYPTAAKHSPLEYCSDVIIKMILDV